MIWFLDFDATGLGPDSVPVQVGWCDENSIGEEHLIRPEADWTDWDYNAQQVHGRTQGDLAVKGRPAAEVARRVVEVLGGQRVHSDAPGFDANWLDVLLAAADYPSDAVRLIDVTSAYAAACRPLFDDLPPTDNPDHQSERALRGRRAAQIVAESIAEDDARGPRQHRALEDARSLQRTWESVRRRVAEAIAG